MHCSTHHRTTVENSLTSINDKVRKSYRESGLLQEIWGDVLFKLTENWPSDRKNLTLSLPFLLVKREFSYYRLLHVVCIWGIWTTDDILTFRGTNHEVWSSKKILSITYIRDLIFLSLQRWETSVPITRSLKAISIVPINLMRLCFTRIVDWGYGILWSYFRLKRSCYCKALSGRMSKSKIRVTDSKKVCVYLDNEGAVYTVEWRLSYHVLYIHRLIWETVL